MTVTVLVAPEPHSQPLQSVVAVVVLLLLRQCSSASRFCSGAVNAEMD